MEASQRRRDRFMTNIIIFGLLLVTCLVLVGYFMSRMPGYSFSGPGPEFSADEQLLAKNLNNHVEMLAGTLGERNVWKYENLLLAADYIEGQFHNNGLQIRFVEYEASGKLVRNIEAEIPGGVDVAEIIVVGAHYDSLVGTVGANDNASGVAILLELARLCRTDRYNKTIRFVAFVNEEPPFFKSPSMGSRVYAQKSQRRGESIVGMISLETIGYFTDEPLSQKFPLPLLRLFYPKEGNFLAFVGNLKHGDLLKQSLAAFRKTAAIPSEGIIAPGWLVGVDWSDHWSFWKEGYPAIMVTDTALFRYPYYHSSNDTPEKLNYPAMSRITFGLREVVKALAQ
jgi:Zn-dependent M28 family amino/carboxypeptidase